MPIPRRVLDDSSNQERQADHTGRSYARRNRLPSNPQPSGEADESQTDHVIDQCRAGRALVGVLSLLSLAGCTGGTKENAPPVAGNAGDHSHKEAPAAAKQGTEDADIKAERAKLSPEDQTLVAAQEFCAISDERLGEMGPPVKLVIKGQPVFLCCGGCKKKALADPDKTLAKVEELKAKVKAAASK